MSQNNLTVVTAITQDSSAVGSWQAGGLWAVLQAGQSAVLRRHIFLQNSLQNSEPNCPKRPLKLLLQHATQSLFNKVLKLAFFMNFI
jgi:hypothetical protein